MVICKQIVKKFSGNIDFLSRFGKGSTFWFTFETLPFEQAILVKAESKLTFSVSNSIVAPSAKVFNFKEHLKVLERFRYKRILVADDEEFCIASMKAMFGQLGVDVEQQVDYCISGLELVNQVKQAFRFNVFYQVIFTDFNMGSMGGIQATREIRRYLDEEGVPRESQPVILGVTGHTKDGL